MRNFRRFATVSSALALAALALPSTALSQATRTWVSGVGDDANPCSRTAPCKTFAGAISKTANGGEINVLDPGGFGGVTITKSLTIKAVGATGGVLVSGTNAIVVNATATDRVVLQGLDINGIGTGAQTSLVGVKVLSASTVIVRNSEITRFKAGVAVVPTSNARVTILGSEIHDNGIGIFNAPGNNLIAFTAVTVRNTNIEENTCGVVSSAFGANASTPDANLNCGAAALGAINKIASTKVFRSDISVNRTGVFSRGASSTVEIGANEITGNDTGFNRPDSGVIKTFGNNHITANGGATLPNQNATTSLKVRNRRSR
jgi:hypothetical protein